MKKFAALAAAGVGALAIGSATSAAAAPTTHISGNFEHSNMQYWCDNGTPNFAFSYRTLNKTEKSVTFSATGYRNLVAYNVDPYTDAGSIVSLSNAAGKSITVWAKGSTTGSSFSVSGKVPTSCAGLPTKQPVTAWVGKPVAQEPTKPAPKPTETKPAPETTKPAPETTKPAPETSKPAPTKPAPVVTDAPKTDDAAGPKIETGTVARENTVTPLMLAGGFAGVAALAGAGVVARRGRQ